MAKRARTFLTAQPSRGRDRHTGQGLDEVNFDFEAIFKEFLKIAVLPPGPSRCPRGAAIGYLARVADTEPKLFVRLLKRIILLGDDDEEPEAEPAPSRRLTKEQLESMSVHELVREYGVAIESMRRNAHEDAPRRRPSLRDSTISLMEMIVAAAERVGEDGRGAQGALGYMVKIARDERRCILELVLCMVAEEVRKEQVRQKRAQEKSKMGRWSWTWSE
jgi:hypothetical protein